MGLHMGLWVRCEDAEYALRPAAEQLEQELWADVVARYPDAGEWCEAHVEYRRVSDAYAFTVRLWGWGRDLQGAGRDVGEVSTELYVLIAARVLRSFGHVAGLAMEPYWSP